MSWKHPRSKPWAILIALLMLLAADSQDSYVDCAGASQFGTKPCVDNSRHQAAAIKRCRCTNVSPEKLHHRKLLYRPECGPLDPAKLENVEQILKCMNDVQWQNILTAIP